MPENSPTERFRSRRPESVPALLVILSLAGFSLAPQAQAPPSSPPENEVKAAYLINFGRFLRHRAPPVPPRSSFDICILGQDPIGHSLDDIAAHEAISNLPVHVRRLADVTDAKGCSIVFITAGDSDEVRENLALLSGSDALTVSDATNFLDRGGMIQFLLIQNHVRFSVNLNAVNRAHLVLSSELLRVASSVIGKPPAEDVP